MPSASGVLRPTKVAGTLRRAVRQIAMVANTEIYAKTETCIKAWWTAHGMCLLLWAVRVAGLVRVPAKVAGTLRRAVRQIALSCDVHSDDESPHDRDVPTKAWCERHMECAYYFDSRFMVTSIDVSNALALLTVSWYSLVGSLSATKPAPA